MFEKKEKWLFTLQYWTETMIANDHLEISWHSTSYIVVLFRWRYKICCVSWFQDGRSQSPLVLNNKLWSLHNLKILQHKIETLICVLGILAKQDFDLSLLSSQNNKDVRKRRGLTHMISSYRQISVHPKWTLTLKNMS